MKATTNGGSAETILHAALKTISRFGYADASVGDIAKEAGVNNVTIYRLFEGKENLFRQVVDHFSEIAFDEEAFALAAKKCRTDEDRLTAMAAAYFRTIFHNIDILRIFVVEVPHFDFVRQAAWYAPPPLLRHCLGCFNALGAARNVPGDFLQRQADMFLSHIVRRAMEYNKHDRIWSYDEDLAADFAGRMRQHVRFTVFLLKRAGEMA